MLELLYAPEPSRQQSLLSSHNILLSLPLGSLTYPIIWLMLSGVPGFLPGDVFGHCYALAG